MSIALIVAACSRAQPVGEPVPVRSSAAALQACDTALQAQAMHADHVPDWQALGIATCYELALRLDPEAATFTGAARITHTNLTDVPLPDLMLRLYPNADVIYGGELALTSATRDGQPLETTPALEDATAVRLQFAEPLTPGEGAEVELEFTGRVQVDFGDLPEVYGIFNLAPAEPVLTLANAFPILASWGDGDWAAEPVVPVGDAVVSDAALFHVEITAPPGWQVVTTGTEVDPSGSDARTFVSGPARDFMIVASPEFALSEAEVNGTNVRHWGLAPLGETARWDEALQATVDSVATYTELFGPYPYAELDVVAAPLRNASGVEYPGLFLLGSALYGDDSQRPFLLGLVAAHEAAHQWWYGVVGNDVLQHPWQDEALATYSSLLYQERHQPRYFDGTLNFYESAADVVEREADDASVDQPVSAFAARDSEYGPIVYLRGSLFFVALRDELGDEVFFAALQEYYARNQYALPTPGDLLDHFEAACDCELDRTFAEWGIEPQVTGT